MSYLNKTNLLKAMVTNKLSDPKLLLDDVDREAVFRVLKRSKAGIPRSIGVTDEPVEEARFAKMPVRDKNRLGELREQLQKNTQKCIVELLAFQRKYPDVPIIYNYIAIAYHYNNQQDKYAEVLFETVSKFPEYLFGKLSLCEYCLNQNKHEEIPKILDRKLEIWMHRPKENIFHISEVRTFLNVVGRYFTRENKLARALYHYFALAGFDPDHPTAIRLGQEIIMKEIENTMDPSNNNVQRKSGKNRTKNQP